MRIMHLIDFYAWRVTRERMRNIHGPLLVALLSLSSLVRCSADDPAGPPTQDGSGPSGDDAGLPPPAGGDASAESDARTNGRDSDTAADSDARPADRDATGTGSEDIARDRDAPSTGGDASFGDRDAPTTDVRIDTSDGGASGMDAPQADGAPPGMCAPVMPQPAVIKVLQPKLFSQGADPSADPECTGVLNPERGIFQFFDLRSLGSLTNLRSQGYTLIYGKTLIDDYRDKDIDAALTQQLTASFAAIRAAGLKVLPRFYYADSGTAPDAPLDRVLRHIEQLAPLWQSNADVIAVLHPGFVGAWGEWHASTNALTEPAARRQIFDAILQALPPDRMSMTRRPSFKREAYGGPLTAATAFSGTPLSRLGHLNDCFLASPNDTGTYQLPGEEQYAVDDSAFVPVGGETCASNPPRSACPSAMVEMARLHWSFINTSYHQTVIQSWKDGGCFSTITCRLGYRLNLLQHEVPTMVRKASTLNVSVRLVNDGYARPYNPRTVYLVLTGPERRVFPVDADPRRWGPGEVVDLCLAANLPADMAAGDYQVGLWMPDRAATLKDNASFAIRLSSGATWDTGTGTNLLDARVAVID